MALQGYILTAADGDMIDQLAWQHSGIGAESLPDILDANPGLSATPALSAGQKVLIPAHLLQRQAVRHHEKLKLWS